VSAANALNQYLEREVDGFMERTRNRPLPAHRMDARVALVFGIALASTAVPLLTFAGGALTGGLALLALGSYVLVYTPMKQVSPMALFIGAVPGALPPLIGWTTGHGRLGAGGLALFAILFFWQIPHFLAIALYRQSEYARAGIKVFPQVYGERATRIHIALSSLVFVLATLVPFFLRTAGVFYFALALASGGAFFAVSLLGLRAAPPAGWARKLFLLSILHLPLIFVAHVLNALR
jgi:protoheme IX farnesyltransferase